MARLFQQEVSLTNNNFSCVPHPPIFSIKIPQKQWCYATHSVRIRILDKQLYRKKKEKVKVIKVWVKTALGETLFPLGFPLPPNKDWRSKKLLYQEIILSFFFRSSDAHREHVSNNKQNYRSFKKIQPPPSGHEAGLEVCNTSGNHWTGQPKPILSNGPK